ncbi:MAG: MATE family efflux transporter [Clostridiales bacterium]|nr:MATE family efflux transporter [Clostridiales bacterium]
MKDMTKGSPIRLILGFAIPLLLGMLFQQFYNLVDMIIVGRFLGSSALAAVGSTGSINFMILGFCMGVCNGFAIPVAQKFGAKDEKQLRYYVANSIWLSIIFAVVMTIAVCALCRNILIWMDTPADIFDASYAYIIVIFMGIPVTYLYNLLSGFMRSLGDSKSPLIFLVISSVLNILFDVVAIAVFHLGVAGAAVATVLAQAISGISSLIYMIRKFPILRVHGEEWKWRGIFVSRLCSMGIPMGLQYSITAIGSVILQTAVNGLGSMAVAAMTAGGKLSMFFCCPFDAFGSTMATYAGQNLGAGKLQRVTKGMVQCSFLAAGYSIVAAIVMILFGKNLALLFVDSTEVELIANVAKLLVINSLFFIPLALVNIIRFAIQGLGFGKLAIFAGVAEMIGRSVVAFGFVAKFGFVAACLASPFAWILADVFLIPAYAYCIRKLRPMIQEKIE